MSYDLLFAPSLQNMQFIGVIFSVMFHLIYLFIFLKICLVVVAE